MGDNQYNKYSQNEYQNAASHYQVKANVSGVGGNNGASQQFAYDVNNSPYVQPGYESNTHLSSLSNCVKRLQTQLNTYLTKIIDEGSEGGAGNYNLGSGEVLNSHLMEQYASGGGPGGSLGGSGGSGGNTPNSASAFGHHPHHHHQQQQQQQHHQEASALPTSGGGVNNGYSYYSNYPANYPNYGHHHHQPVPGAPPGHSGGGYGGSMITGSAAAAAAADFYNQQYSSFQEPKPKKQKNK